jgi:hypothetical protein
MYILYIMYVHIIWLFMHTQLDCLIHNLWVPFLQEPVKPVGPGWKYPGLRTPCANGWEAIVQKDRGREQSLKAGTRALGVSKNGVPSGKLHSY